jgi:hypothetical protein
MKFPLPLRERVRERGRSRRQTGIEKYREEFMTVGSGCPHPELKNDTPLDF